MKEIKTIEINYDDVSSLQKAERTKARCENQGWNLLKTVQTGINTFNMIYVKGGSK